MTTTPATTPREKTRATACAAQTERRCEWRARANKSRRCGAGSTGKKKRRAFGAPTRQSASATVHVGVCDNIVSRVARSRGFREKRKTVHRIVAQPLGFPKNGARAAAFVAQFGALDLVQSRRRRRQRRRRRR
jgi:hypothetical protein